MRSLLLAASIFTLVACTAVEPEVGPQQASSSSCGSSSSSGGGSIYGGAPSSQGDAGACKTPDPRCAPDAGYEGSACDACQDLYCCSQRFLCYDNPACFAADAKLDACVEGADAGDVTQCWSDFRAAVPLAAILTDCEKAYCASVCGVPP